VGKPLDEQKAMEERFKVAAEAYGCLADKTKRSEYNSALAEKLTQKLVHEWENGLGKVFDYKPSNYDTLPKDEQAFFETTFTTESSQQKATEMLRELGFNRPLNMEDRYPHDFITTHNDNEGTSLVFSGQRMEQYANGVIRALKKMSAEWGEGGLGEKFNLREKVRDYLSGAVRNYFTTSAAEYSKAAEAAFLTPEGKRRFQELVRERDALLRVLEAYSPEDRKEQAKKKTAINMLGAIGRQ
jgi:curved DNA-binding protein CbpA